VRPSTVTCGTAISGLPGAVVCGGVGAGVGASGVVVGGEAGGGGGLAGGVVVAGVPFAGGACAVATPARLSSSRAEPASVADLTFLPALTQAIRRNVKSKSHTRII
jgi:hypothetical protein